MQTRARLAPTAITTSTRKSRRATFLHQGRWRPALLGWMSRHMRALRCFSAFMKLCPLPAAHYPRKGHHPGLGQTGPGNCAVWRSPAPNRLAGLGPLRATLVDRLLSEQYHLQRASGFHRSASRWTKAGHRTVGDGRLPEFKTTVSSEGRMQDSAPSPIARGNRRRHVGESQFGYAACEKHPTSVTPSPEARSYDYS